MNTTIPNAAASETRLSITALIGSTIERNARAQAELIEDILDVSRIIAGKLRIEIHPVDLQSIVDVAVDAVRPAAEAKGITLERRTGALPERFTGDAVRLLKSVVEKSPNEPVVNYHLGIAYHRAGDVKQAEVYLAKAVQAGRPFFGADDARAVLDQIQ